MPQSRPPATARHQKLTLDLMEAGDPFAGRDLLATFAITRDRFGNLELVVDSDGVSQELSLKLLQLVVDEVDPEMCDREGGADAGGLLEEWDVEREAVAEQAMDILGYNAPEETLPWNLRPEAD